MVTCFSDEAHSIVSSCNEIIPKLQEIDPYTIPPQLTALLGKTYIFQLHFGSDSTKEQRFFFLDKAWDTTPLIAPADDTWDIPTPNKSPNKTTTLHETKLTTTPIEENMQLPKPSVSKDEQKTASARRPLFQHY